MRAAPTQRVPLRHSASCIMCNSGTLTTLRHVPEQPAFCSCQGTCGSSMTLPRLMK